MNMRGGARIRIGHPLSGVLLSYAVLCGVMLPWFLHRVAPDAVSYLTIARKYRAWDFSNAINGYWSPLLSWLLAPLLCLGAPAEITATFLQVTIGAGALVAAWWLGKRLELPEAVRGWTTLCLVPAVAMYALSDTTPDLLVAVILVAYLGVVMGADYPRSLRQGALCGLLGALAYLAKAYAFPFFLAHYLAVSGYLLLRRRSNREDVGRLAAATATGLLVFAVVAGSWAGLISRKYSRITIGTTGSYQFSLFNGGGGGLFGQGGLFPPANATAINAWEDPTDLRTPPRPARSKSAAKSKPKAAAGPLPKPSVPAASAPGRGSAAARAWVRCRETLLHVGRNVVRLAWTLVRFSWLSPFILLGLLIACGQVASSSQRDRWVILLGAMLIYSSGYLLIFIQERYFWFVTFLLVTSAGLLAATVPILRRDPWRGVWAVAVCLSFMIWPAWVLVRLRHNVLEATPAWAATLSPMVSPGSRIASDQEWGITNAIAYYLDARYYGLLPVGASAEEWERQLREHKIAYLVVWGDLGDHAVIATARELSVDLGGGDRSQRAPRVFALQPIAGEPESSGTIPADRP